MGDRCVNLCNWGSVRGHAGRHSVQPKREKNGDNHQHVVTYLRGCIVRARPEHDVADIRAVSRRFRVRVSEYLPEYFHLCSIVLVSSNFPFFVVAVSCHFSFLYGSFLYRLFFTYFFSICCLIIFLFVCLYNIKMLLLLLSMLLSIFLLLSQYFVHPVLWAPRPLPASSSLCYNYLQLLHWIVRFNYISLRSLS